MTTKELGELGERLACEYLVGRGFMILGKNYRISFGEIDIIAKKQWRLFKNDKTLHFIEVKTLKTQNPQSIFPEDHVDFKKKRKLKQMAQIWLGKNKYSQCHPYQIDVIGVLINEIGGIAKLYYFPNTVEEL